MGRCVGDVPRSVFDQAVSWKSSLFVRPTKPEWRSSTAMTGIAWMAGFGVATCATRLGAAWSEAA